MDKREILEEAERTRQLFKGSAKKQTRILKKLFAEAELVFAVYPDTNSEDGWGYHPIKGVSLLAQIVQDKLTRRAPWTAVFCREPAEAEAMRQVLGDGANLN